MNVHNCKKTMSLHPSTTAMMDPHKTANTNHNPKGGATINKGVGTPTNNLNTANPITTTIHHKIPKTQDTNLHIVSNSSASIPNRSSNTTVKWISFPRGIRDQAILSLNQSKQIKIKLWRRVMMNSKAKEQLRAENRKFT
ncbi:hypothetical protein PIB30_066258 [Stylosanthes scabra]|uniref:Uncharacterized protein n=1 Tax=Stylosanthes scabra TaxID=79078 RepID=A0ABU6RMZ9_9FABA|nr:hypothetical protein [Stylosanthes scabra]